MPNPTLVTLRKNIPTNTLQGPDPSVRDSDEELTPEQRAIIQRINFVLDTLTLDQLVQIAGDVRGICEGSGFGTVQITIKKGHPDTIEKRESKKLHLALEEAWLKELISSDKTVEVQICELEGEVPSRPI